MLENLNSSRVAVCLPASNERDNLEVLLPELERALISLALPMPLVVVFDDGSTDGTVSWLRGCEFSGFEFIVMRSTARVGKASALNHAITRALELGASSVFMMDADGQDDPANIGPMLEQLDSGAEVVNARRVNRSHNFAKRFSSRLFNGVVRLVTAIEAQDINSGMKAFNRQAAEVLVPYFYGELHRVILIVAIRVGLEVEETKVHNRPRLAGSSKYGAARGWRGLIDFLTLQFLQRYHAKPGHFFSGFGSLFLLGGLTTVLVGLLTRPGDLFNAGFGLIPWVGLGGMGMGVMLMGFGFVTELMLFIAKNPTTAVVRVHETPRS
ncbi:glycosyltransferase family 2 protein [Pontimonas sp.]|nr:glycosyltransferase family 2 protein [Pontimonas sp.]MDA9116839.1 glycosyltransferase family 2 protein [Pontimonas sp.]